MSAKRINPRLIKLRRSYTVEEVSLRLGVHKNTVRSWQRRGLEPIDKVRPVLFTGKTLRAYLEGKRKAAKRPCPPGTCYLLQVPKASRTSAWDGLLPTIQQPQWQPQRTVHDLLHADEPPRRLCRSGASHARNRCPD
jgi:Helix-turn-helix domain